MSRTFQRVAVLLVAVQMLAGCAVLVAEGPRRARPDLVDLADRVRALEAKVAAQEAEVARLRSLLDARPNPSPTAAATALPATPAVASTAQVDARGAEPPKARPAAAIESSDLENLDLPSSAEATSASGNSPASDYELGGARYREGRYLEAEEAYWRYLDHGEPGELADNALFWIGAARLARGEFAAAEEAFRQVVELYPTGNKVPDALLKLASCRDLAGDTAGAEAALRAILERFPATEAAATAARRLQAPVATP